MEGLIQVIEFQKNKIITLKPCNTVAGIILLDLVLWIIVIIISIASILESESCPLSLFKRFLDDIFMVYSGSVESLNLFLIDINNILVFYFKFPFSVNIVSYFCLYNKAVPPVSMTINLRQITSHKPKSG